MNLNIDNDVYVHIVLLILPINSVVNPLIYCFAQIRTSFKKFWIKRMKLM